MKQDESINILRGKRLTTALKFKNIKQEWLAMKIGYTAPYISMLANGKREFTLELVNECAKALDILPEYLTGETDQMEKNDFDEIMKVLDAPTLARSRDLAFLRYLSAFPNTIIFHCIREEKLLSEIKHIDTIKENDYKTDINISDNFIAEFNSISGKLKILIHDTKETVELTIYSVSIDDQRIPYGQFLFMIQQTEMYCRMLLSKAVEYSSNFEFCVYTNEHNVEYFSGLDIDIKADTKASNPAEKALFS